MHTKLVSLFIALFLCLPLFAQKESVPRIDSEGVYLIPDEMPKFPGGMQAMMKYLATNVKYPVEAQKKGVSGRVIIQFVVMEDGTPGQGKVVRGVDPLLDEEALRVVKTMVTRNGGWQGCQSAFHYSCNVQPVEKAKWQYSEYEYS